MKDILCRFLFPAVAASVMAAGCGKEDNPRPKKFAAADFSITITERRQTHDFTYAYDKASGRLSIDPGEQELQELWVTAWNDVTLMAMGTERSFEGVNVRSESPDILKVHRNSDGSFGFDYVSDGSSAVTVWSGGEFSYSFRVFTKECINPEYMLVDIGGREFRCKFRDYPYDRILQTTGNITFEDERRMGFMEDTCRFSLGSIRINKAGKPAMVQYTQTGLSKDGRRDDLTYIYDTADRYAEDGALMEIKGIYPENSSWRDVSLIYSAALDPLYTQESLAAHEGLTGFYLNYDCHRYGLPGFMRGSEEKDLDFSDIQGRRAYLVRYWNIRPSHDNRTNLSFPSHLFRVVIRRGYGKLQQDKEKSSLIYSYILCWPEDPSVTFTDYAGVLRTF